MKPKDPLIEYLNSFLTPSSIVLDIGCGTKKIAKELKCAKVITLDVWKPFEPDILCDLSLISSLPCNDNSVDMVLLIDVIEHLPKEQGFKILKEAQRVAGKHVVILTPLWWDPNVKECNDPRSPYYQNEYDKHLSLWEVNDLKEFERNVFIPVLEKYFLGVWKKEPPKKIDLFFDISHICNYNCLFCRSSLLPDEVLKLEQIKNINELLIVANSVDITGYGEVTIHPQFNEFIQYFKKFNVSVRFVTNGSNLTEKIVEQIIDSTVSEIVISINSLNTDTYKKITGEKGDLSKTLLGVEYLIKRNEESKRNIRIVFSFVITQYTFPEIKDIIDFAKKHNKEASLLDLTPTIKDYAPDLLVPDTEENRKHLSSMSEYIRSIGAQVSIFGFDNRKAVTTAAKDDTALSDIIKRCDWVYTKAFIGFDGNVGVCCWSNAQMGNIKEQPFSEIWSGLKYQELRDCIRRGDLKYCKNCRREG